MLQIQMLGDFSIKVDGNPLTTLNKPRLQSLLAYLIFHREASQFRYHLANIFWPDSDEAQARTNLRKLLLQLRQAMPQVDLYLRLEGQKIQWVNETPLVFDVQEFENAVLIAGQGTTDELDQLIRAVQLYQGDLLPSIYDEWIETERERLSRKFTNALQQLITVQERKRDYYPAIASAERLLHLDVFNETAHRNLIRLHALAGDRAGALRAYQSCVTVLKDELSIEPSTETRDLYVRLVNNNIEELRSPSASAEPQIKPLVGRECEWMAMQQAWNRISEGHPLCIILSGEAGIGKTRLAEEMLRWVSRQGYRSASARCFASEGGLAYAPVADWLRAGELRKQWVGLDSVWLTELTRVMPEIKSERPDLPQPERLSTDWQRRRLFEALVRALNPALSLASGVPMALLIDDLQWCDSETLAWLHYLMRSAIPAKLLLIGTLRSEELTPGHALESWLEDLRSDARLEEFALGPLSEVETKVLAENESGRMLEPDEAARLFADTEGHPLFVVESVRMADDLVPAPAGWVPLWESISQPPSSPTIRAVIARRLALLSPAARDLAGLAATIGHFFTYKVLSTASKEIAESTLVDALDELWQRRIVREHGTNAYDFSHDKIRTAAYQGLSSARRRFLHRCVAESLENLAQESPIDGFGKGLDELSGQIGSHFQKAGLPDRAIPYYQQAAEVALRIFANEQALRYFQSARALLKDPAGRFSNPSLAAHIEEQTGDLLLLMTRRVEARAAYERGLQFIPLSERIDQATLVRKMGNTWRDDYHFEKSLSIYSLALETLGDPTNLDGDAGQKWWQCWIQIQIEIQNVYYWLAWIEKGETLYLEMRPVVERYATFLQRAIFFQLMGMMRLRANRYVATEEIVALIETAVEASIKGGIAERIPADHFGYGFILLHHNDLHRAEEEIGTALRLAELHGDFSLETRCLTYLTIARRKKGDVDQVHSLALRALASAENAKMPEYAGAARANLAWVAQKAGISAEARENGLAALELWNQSPGIQAAATPYYWTAIWPLIQVCLDEGNLTTAFFFARKLLEPQRKSLPTQLMTVLGRAIDAWDSDHPQNARDTLLSAAALAETLGEF